MITVRLIIRPWEVNYTFISCCKRAKLIIKQSVRSLPLFIINLTLWKQRNSGRLDRRLGSFSSLLTWLICNEMKRKREISQWKKRREITEPHQPQILGGCNGWMLSEEQEGRDKVSEVHAFSSLLLLPLVSVEISWFRTLVTHSFPY